jgi:hypothetical protein
VSFLGPGEPISPGHQGIPRGNRNIFPTGVSVAGRMAGSSGAKAPRKLRRLARGAVATSLGRQLADWGCFPSAMRKSAERFADRPATRWTGSLSGQRAISGYSDFAWMHCCSIPAQDFSKAGNSLRHQGRSGKADRHNAPSKRATIVILSKPTAARNCSQLSSAISSSVSQLQTRARP